MRAANHAKQLLLLVLAGCCAVPKPPPAPQWLGSGLDYPAVHMCSAYCAELAEQVDQLQRQLNGDYQACRGNTACQQTVIAAGRRVWQIAVATYGTVNANVPVSDKRQALNALHEAVVAIPRPAS